MSLRALVSSFVASVSLCGAAALGAETLFSVSGVDGATIQGTVDAFRTSLGTLNPNTSGSAGSGRREINWDGVPDASSAPSPFLPDFFNAVSPRGTILVGASATTTFSVSADSTNATATPTRFANVNAGYATAFVPFSAERMFSSISNNVYDVDFVIPGSTTPAAVRGFGAVFTDVDVDGSTTIEFFRGNESLRKDAVASLAGNGSLSFLGVDFGENIVTRVRITAGAVALGPDDVTQGGGSDVVVADDFIYGEPVLVTPSIAGLLGNLQALRADVVAAGAGASARKALVKRLDGAIDKVTKARAKFAAGKTGAARGLLRAAANALASFEKQLDATKSVNGLDEPDRRAFARIAADLGVDCATLIRTPA